jgi:uncharacterized protein
VSVRCDAVLEGDGIASICGYECTFCAACTVEMDHVCPNGGGEPVALPRRLSEEALTQEMLAVFESTVL